MKGFGGTVQIAKNSVNFLGSRVLRVCFHYLTLLLLYLLFFNNMFFFLKYVRKNFHHVLKDSSTQDALKTITKNKLHSFMVIVFFKIIIYGENFIFLTVCVQVVTARKIQIRQKIILTNDSF